MKKYALALIAASACFLMTTAFADCGCKKPKPKPAAPEEVVNISGIALTNT